MTLRTKTLIIISVTLVGLIVLLYFISQTILLSSYAQLEEQGVRQNVERVQAALLDKLATLNSTAGDWAPWDDTYAFVEDRNEQYIENNLPSSTLSNLKLNFMLFINTSDQLVFGKAVDLQSASAMDVPQSLQDYLASNKLILRHANPEDSVTGLIPLPEDPLLFASWPILTSNSEGPIQGTLVVGRYLDAAEIESLAEATRLSISLRRFDDPQLPPDYQAARAALAKDNSIFVRPLNEDRIAGYTLVEDAYGQPILVLKIDMPREVYKQGQASLSYFILLLLVSGLVFGLVIMLLLEKGVLSRLTQLSQSVSSIGASGNSSGRVSVTGSDELTSLGRNINKMLAALGQSEEALRKAHNQLEARVEQRTAELSKSNQLLKQEIQERQQAEEALRQSEQRFRQLVSSISDHIYVTEITPDGNPINLYLSHHVEVLTGYPLEKFADDWSFWPTRVIHPEDQAEAALQAARLAKGENSQLEYRLVRANSEIIWVRDSGRVEKDSARQSLIIYGVVSDITKRKQVEEALVQSEQRTRLIINTALDAVITMDAEGLITDWSTQAETIFGWSRREAVGRFLHATIIPTQYWEAHQHGLKHFLATGEGPVLNKRIEITALHRDGHEFPVELAISPLQLGESITFSAFVRDVTKRKQAEVTLALAHDQALEASRLKSQLLANVSHDLRTPLSAIVGYIDMLQVGVYGPLLDKQRSITQRVMNSTAHLTNMVNKLLDQAHLEAGTLKVTVISFSPASLIEQVHATLDVLAETKGLQLTSDIAANMPPSLSSDFVRLQQIIINLVDNAIKFTEQGSVHVCISRFDEAYWAIQVADTGPGIPAEAYAYIFDAFRQVDGTATRRYSGFGLGLSIVNQLTTLMGGQVKVESKLGQGSTFSVLLPLTYEREVVT